LFALLTALFNGLASVLQRMAAADAPAAKALHVSLFGYLIRRKVWLAGIGMVMLAAVCQAIALATGPVALVQPICILELPFTLLVASRLAHRKLPRMTWWAVGLVTVALGIGLAAAAPSGRNRRQRQGLGGRADRHRNFPDGGDHGGREGSG
jgi:drug/metabolite transporter (DMT)-like permease